MARKAAYSKVYLPRCIGLFCTTSACLHLGHPACPRHHSTKAAHHLAHAALGSEFFHHLLHLFMLLNQTTDVLHLCARTHGNTTTARTTDNFRVTALSWRHRVDDRLHLFKLLFSCTLRATHLR